MASALVALATTTLASSSATVTFSSISGAYRDLRLVINAKPTATVASMRIRLNSDTGSNYANVGMYGEAPSTAGSFSATTTFFYGDITTLDNSFGNSFTMDLLDYTATDKHKTALTRSGQLTRSDVAAFAGRWANTAAVTSITVLLSANSFDVGSTFSLYGIVS